MRVQQTSLVPPDTICIAMGVGWVTDTTLQALMPTGFEGVEFCKRWT